MTQSMAAEMLADTPWLDAHLAVLRREYACRATALTSALVAEFGDRLSVSRPAGGMFAWATFLDGTDTGGLLDAALDHGVAFVPGAAFASGAQYRHSLRLSFAGSTPTVLAEAVRRLGAAHSASTRAT